MEIFKVVNRSITKGILSLSLSFIFSVSSSVTWAANECGVAVAGGSIICDGDGTPATDVNNYSGGIKYLIDGLTLNVNGAATVITTSTNIGIFLDGTGSNSITENLAATLSINTSAGVNHDGVIARQNGTATGAIFLNSSANILATGNDGEGLLGWIANTANSEGISINASGDIETQGVNASAIYAYTVGTGAIHINSDANLTTAGTYSDAVIGFINSLTSTAAIELTSITGEINTTGANSPAISAYHSNAGDITISSSAEINTGGAASHGIYANPYTAGKTSNVSIDVTGGSIDTTSHDADGVFADLAGDGEFSVIVGNTTINSGSIGIHSAGVGGGTIDIASDATIVSTGGISIRDGDRNADATDEVGGDVIISSNGILTGNIIMGLGDDTLNLTGGNIVGDVYGDDITPSAADGDDVFNWSAGILSGGFYGGNGSDIAVITGSGYTGNELLDGGDDTDSADGWIDVLTFKNIQASVAIDSLTNWEEIVVDNASIGFLSPTELGTKLIVLSGSIVMQNDTAGDTLTVGDYTSGGGRLDIDTVLGSSSSESDTLIIQGIATGTTEIDINNIGGTGALTTGNGILIVLTSGNGDAEFVLANGPIRVGDYVYMLVQSGNNWYLQSKISPVQIPTLNQWGLMVLMFLMMFVGFYGRQKNIKV